MLEEYTEEHEASQVDVNENEDLPKKRVKRVRKNKESELKKTYRHEGERSRQEDNSKI